MDAFSDLFLDAEQCESTACVELELDSSDIMAKIAELEIGLSSADAPERLSSLKEALQVSSTSWDLATSILESPIFSSALLLLSECDLSQPSHIYYALQLINKLLDRPESYMSRAWPHFQDLLQKLLASKPIESDEPIIEILMLLLDIMCLKARDFMAIDHKILQGTISIICESLVTTPPAAILRHSIARVLSTLICDNDLEASVTLTLALSLIDWLENDLEDHIMASNILSILGMISLKLLTVPEFLDASPRIWALLEHFLALDLDYASVHPIHTSIPLCSLMLGSLPLILPSAQLENITTNFFQLLRSKNRNLRRSIYYFVSHMVDQPKAQDQLMQLNILKHLHAALLDCTLTSDQLLEAAGIFTSLVGRASERHLLAIVCDPCFPACCLGAMRGDYSAHLVVLPIILRFGHSIGSSYSHSFESVENPFMDYIYASIGTRMPSILAQDPYTSLTKWEPHFDSIGLSSLMS